ncbi:MAG: endonuclease III [Candidatus Aenigmatarchaeota archaeon]|nr:MAG: endonuclease III [Candidatus Aenigmarchaeota archaeon]
MTKEIKTIIKEMKRQVGSTVATVQHEDPFRVLIATVLSQRTRDENTEKAAKSLFKKYNTPRKLAVAKTSDIEKLIKPSGFYKVKARRIKKISKILLEKYGGKVPRDIESLIKLPGVGRKTANCVLVYAFGTPSIPVDTHVHRISNRLGLVQTKTPAQTESELIKVVPKKYWLIINELMVKFGQRVCKPRKPRCDICKLKKMCRYHHNTLEHHMGF